MHLSGCQGNIKIQLSVYLSSLEKQGKSLTETLTPSPAYGATRAESAPALPSHSPI